MSRVGQTAEKESWRCRGDRQTAEKESWRCRGDRQTAGVRKASGVESWSNRQSEKGWWQNFQVEIPATESWQPVRIPDRDVSGSPPLQGNKNSCDAYTGENDKSDPDHADQNPWGCFRQGSIPHTAGNYDRDDHHADGVTDGAHSC